MWSWGDWWIHDLCDCVYTILTLINVLLSVFQTHDSQWWISVGFEYFVTIRCSTTPTLLNNKAHENSWYLQITPPGVRQTLFYFEIVAKRSNFRFWMYPDRIQLFNPCFKSIVNSTSNIRSFISAWLLLFAV